MLKYRYVKFIVFCLATRPCSHSTYMIPVDRKRVRVRMLWSYNNSSHASLSSLGGECRDRVPRAGCVWYVVCGKVGLGGVRSPLKSSLVVSQINTSVPLSTRPAVTIGAQGCGGYKGYPWQRSAF